jgi:hypothetical protein
MKNRIFIILLLSSFYSFGQNNSDKSKLLKSGNFQIDSIEVKVFVYENRIETENYFEKSKSKLSVIYLKKNEDFNKIVTRENCPSIPEDFWRTYVFDFENGKVVNEEEDGEYYSSGRMHGIAGRLDREVKNSYNKNLKSEFLKKFAVELFEKIKNYR